MIVNILTVMMVVFLIEELIRYKINLFGVFQEKKDGKISSKRVSMLICTGLFVWMGKTIIISETIEPMEVVIMFVVGLFAFFPNSARELIAKFLDKQNDK